MLKLVIPAMEAYDEEKNLFFDLPEKELQLEHSLVSLSKWESKWKKPFLSKEDKTKSETIDYIRQMTMTQNVDDSIYSRLTQKHIDTVRDYIDDAMTATTFSEVEKRSNNQVITAEIIYYWMVAFNIPFECQKWHLNRLLTLIKVCNIKNQPAKKMGRKAAANKQRALNEARKAKLNTTG